MAPAPKPTLTRPPDGRFIAFTLFAGLMLNLLPLQGAVLLARPDFLLVVLLYWAVSQPLRVGMAAGWSLGLVMDIADGALLGQYGLAYTVAVFLALALHRRIQSFGLWPQALHVSVLLMVSQTLVLLVHLIKGDDFIGWAFFAATLTGTLAWPLVSLLIQLGLRQQSLPEISHPATRSPEK